MSVASGRTPYRPKRWQKGDGFWEDDEAQEREGGTADGFRRIGTNLEILSWPGVEPQVRTEQDEAVAQSLLKNERETLRAKLKAKESAARSAARQKKRREDKEFMERQQERVVAQMEALWSEEERRRTFSARQAKIEDLGLVHSRLSCTNSFAGISEAAFVTSAASCDFASPANNSPSSHASTPPTR